MESTGLKSLDLLFLALDIAKMEMHSADPVISAAAKELIIILSPIKAAITLGHKAIARLEESMIHFANAELTIMDNGDESDFND